MLLNSQLNAGFPMTTKLNSSLAVLFLVTTLFLAGCGDDQGSGNSVPLESGLQTIQSSGVEREYYLLLPGDEVSSAAVTAASVSASNVDEPKPLLFTYHGYTSSYEAWVGENRSYDLIDVVGDDAIVVAPNGLPNSNGQRVWGGEDDQTFFLDMLAEFDRRGLNYDPNRIFVAGHSNGASFTHELGCAHGDVIRAIVTAAGALIDNDCVGSAAVFMMHGSNDPLSSGSLAAGGLRYWVLYNGWDPDAFVKVGPCDDYSFPGEPNSPYPVLWCEHLQGHGWPDFGSEAAWGFLQSLDEAAPTPDAPAGGGNERATPPSDANLTFQLAVPATMNRPLRSVVTLRAPSWVDSPTCSSPDVVLGEFSVDGVLVPGEVSDPITLPITYLDFSGQLQFPSEVALSITIYVEGGSPTVIPDPGVDHDAANLVTLISRETDLIVSDVMTLTPVPNLCGF